jgi:hypothetical protein
MWEKRVSSGGCREEMAFSPPPAVVVVEAALK